jgi:hypothetical protein
VTSVNEFVKRYKGMEREGRSKWLAAVEAADIRDVETVLQDFNRVDMPAQLWDSVGSSPEEIEAIRQKYSGWLPASIEAFLLLAGTRRRLMDAPVSCTARSILEGDATYLEWTQEVRENGVPEWYGDGSRFAIPAEAFHLDHHGGGTFYYILDDNDDPIVHVMYEGPEWPTAHPVGISSMDMRFSECVAVAFSEKTELLIGSLATAKKVRECRAAEES